MEDKVILEREHVMTVYKEGEKFEFIGTDFDNGDDHALMYDLAQLLELKSKQLKLMLVGLFNDKCGCEGCKQNIDYMLWVLFSIPLFDKVNKFVRNLDIKNDYDGSIQQIKDLQKKIEQLMEGC